MVQLLTNREAAGGLFSVRGKSTEVSAGILDVSVERVGPVIQSLQ